MSDLDQTVDEPAREPVAPVSAESTPSRIGRYRIERVLGKGGFGIVYLAHDDQLIRPVAIKVPHRNLVDRSEDADAYLTEARTVANLDHPNIVPVYDVGSTEQFPCYVVAKYIDGADLATRLKQCRLKVHETVDLVATVAEALHYAHKQGLVHRDIKPGNILLDQSGQPFVADFGLALREQDVGKGPRHAGTPAYMSPEQARGEGHRVDGRSDIFSLGVVFYELLTGRRPCRADSQEELLEQITSIEARPPRQVDDAIPKELDRICLKALAKRASERYSTAQDLAEDLRHFLSEAPSSAKSTITGRQRSETEVSSRHTPCAVADGTRSVPATAASASQVGRIGNPSYQPVKIVPKGLRSFDANDADFFLELLPGPRDRDGLPESIRFWKTRIETTDADNTFSVGLIYGPSGCGKSSLVKAGLLPRLARAVTPVYLEATGDETEARLLKGLRRQVPDLPGNLGLIESLSALRQGRFLAAGQKVLLVLDQFEQWLHAKPWGPRRNEENTELVQALRQCDGERVQGLVMVRDDFWLAVSRFMKAMEVEILEGRNSALVDLFDPLHARKVLAALGQAHGRLPDNLGQNTKDQHDFLDQAVAGLAQEGKVTSVRLALFAEMVKGKPWTPATLQQVGGIEGVGVTFLEETFAASTAPPQHRLHQKAAQAVLKASLPEQGTDIKGNMRSQQELLAASGYAAESKNFDALLRILDGELRLITPTDPEGVDADIVAFRSAKGRPFAERKATEVVAGQKYYQLTHDYLVPSLRDWLTVKQKETHRGRAELLLADRAAVWNARPENRQLPSLLQWCQIRWLTRKKNWTPPQGKMMSKATRYHVLRGVVVALILALIGWGGYQGYGTLKAHALRERLLDANTNEVATIVQDMVPYRRWLDALLHEAAAGAEASKDARKQLHASLALLPVDDRQVAYLYGRLLDAEPHEVPVIRDFLAPHQDALKDKLWVVVERPAKGKEAQRLRAASALAKYDPQSAKWLKANALVVNDLVLENAVFLGHWSEAFRPVKGHLLSPLSVIFRDHQAERSAERKLATNLLADYAADQPQVLADLLMDADDKQFAVFYPKVKEHGDRSVSGLLAEIDKQAGDGDKERLAKRQANAAVALLKMDRPEKVWPLLKHSPDPTVRSYLIHRLYPLGADAGAIVKRLDEEPDLTIRRALLLSLGEYGDKELSAEAGKALLAKLQGIYRTEADPGLHASAEWLLRSWKREAWLKQVNDEWAQDKEQREKRLEEIKHTLAKASRVASAPGAPPQWYVNGQGQTMVVIPGPVEFVMGSPTTEVKRRTDEPQHKKRIGRTFAIAAKSVTKEQFLRFHADFTHSEMRRYPAPTCPIGGVLWYEAAAYCNWLSKEEGIDKDQWCYETNPNGQVTKLKENYLSLTGYRLPTESEMEYAARAGAVTSRYFGESDELLPKYAWYQKNSQEQTWPVGSLKPNDLGLFDVHGNIFTWCQDRYKNYPTGKETEASDDQEDDLLEVATTDGRVLRGGSFLDLASLVRCAHRDNDVPTDRYLRDGFRLARTLPLGSFTHHN